MPTSTAEPRQVSPFAGGAGRQVRVKGTKKCAECGKDVSIDFKGAADSVGVRVSRRWLAKGTRVLCEECLDRDDAARWDAELQERREEARVGRIEKSGVPERWKAGVTFEKLERDKPRAEAIDAALAWALADNPKGLLLHGPVGRGKTVIAAAAAMERLQRRHLKWLSVAALLTDLRGGFDSPEYKRALRSIDAQKAMGALVLDDLDKLKPTESALQPLYVAINGWIERPLPLLVTCNRSPDEIASWAGATFGEALASRLLGYCQVIEVRGRDRRLS